MCVQYTIFSKIHVNIYNFVYMFVGKSSDIIYLYWLIYIVTRAAQNIVQLDKTKKNRQNLLDKTLKKTGENKIDIKSNIN